MEFTNFRRLEDDKQPVFPTWGRAKKESSSLGNIFGSIVGVIIWLFLIAIFLLTAYLYWFQQNLVIILKTFKPGPYHIPWWFSLLVFIFLMPLTLAVILVGTLIQVAKR